MALCSAQHLKRMAEEPVVRLHAAVDAAGRSNGNSPELIAKCNPNPVRRQLLGELTLPNTNGGIHPFDEGAPLIRLFEGQGFVETWEP